MKLTFVAVGAVIAFFPMASFVLIALEVVMVYLIAKSYEAVHVGDLVWFCSRMVVISVFLKFIAAWLHLVPLIGQVANSLVAATFIFFAYGIADAHYQTASKR